MGETHEETLEETLQNIMERWVEADGITGYIKEWTDKHMRENKDYIHRHQEQVRWVSTEKDRWDYEYKNTEKNTQEKLKSS